MGLNNNQKKIVSFIKKQSKPVPPKTVSAALNIPPNTLKKELAPLVATGTVIRLKSGKLAPPRELNLMTGRIDGHPDGFAFFIPDDTDKDDLFVPPKKLNGALHNDRVAVRMEMFRGRPEAHVSKILERGTQKVVGRVEKSKHFAYVVPFVKKMFLDVYLPKAAARNTADGDVVVCEITRFPSPGKNPEGKIAKKLGTMKDPGIENRIVMEKYDLVPKFPSPVNKEANEAAKALKENPGKRTDFSKLFTVTIDGETARDFDDAISIEKTATGYVLHVHIADVAHFVRPGTMLDSEAFNRGTSVYFPEFAIPMLPEKLSNDICSLRPNVKRLTMTARIEYDKKGNRVGSKFYQSTIKSNHRLTYTYVNDVIQGKQQAENDTLFELILTGQELALKLIEKRKGMGMLDFDLPEAEFIFDEEGNIADVIPAERAIAHRMIENFMIEANEAVSEFLEQKVDTSVFRVHGSPDKKKILAYKDLIKSFGIDIDLREEITPMDIQRMSQAVMNSPYGHVLSAMLIRSMQKAVYTTDNIGHFGLASPSYTHFTSPIRRYPDLMIHRLLKTHLFGYDFKISNEELERQASHSSEKEQFAVQAEREIHQFKKLRFLEEHPDDVYDAYINRVSHQAIFIFMDKLLMTGMIHISLLEEDYYEVDEDTGTLNGRHTGVKYRIGDPVRVQVEKVNYDFLEADFRLAEEE